jgi:subtilase family serine protease
MRRNRGSASGSRLKNFPIGLVMNPNRILTSLSRAVAVVFAASLLPCGLFAQATPPVVQSRITQTIDNNFRVTLHGMVSPLANAANDRGAAPASMQVDRIHMVLKRSAAQEAALRSLIQEQNSPGSPEYHKWLTPAQFGQQFGPSSQDIAKIQSWLESEGFSGVKVNPGALTVEFNGTVSQVAHAFGAQYHRYDVNGRTYDAVANNPQIPAALAPVVQGFVALNNFPVHKYTRVLGKATYNPQTRKATAEWTYPTGGGVNFPLSPQDFGVQYNLPNSTLNSTYSSGSPQYTGAGQTIAIINEANINVSLVNSFRSLFGLPANPPNVIVVGNDPGIDGINNPTGPNGASIEAYLDVEEAGAVAPSATIDLVIAGDTASENGLILAAEHAVYSDVAPVMSLSFGLCEQQLGPSNAFINQLWEQAAAEGITVMVSSGDNGSAGCDSSSSQYAVNGTAVSGMASTPYDVAVGGTDFYYSDWNQGSSTLQTQIGSYWNTSPSTTPQPSILQHIPEQAWNDSQFGDNALNYYQLLGTTTIGSGSGGASSCVTGTTNTTTGAYSACSGGYAKPAWQTGVGVPADKVRDIPDVSLFAADGANYSYYPICAQDGDCQTPASGSPVQITGVGGTSAASPAFAGIMALVNEKYGPQGQADNVLYALAAQDPTAFYDVTAGSNSVPCAYSSLTSLNSANCIAVSNPITVTTSTGATVTEGQLGSGTTPSYNATAGYDLATGLGSVNAANLVNDWGNVKFTTSAVTLTSPTAGTTITHGYLNPVTFTGTVTGTSGTPTGDVSIMTSSTLPGQQGQTYFTLNSGAFNGSINYLPGGTYNVWARYAGDSKNAAAESAPVQITVNPENSTLLFQGFTYNSSGSQVSVSGQSIPYGTQVYFDATPYGSSFYSNCVKVSTPPSNCTGETAATGTVAFTDGSTALNTAVVDSEGTAEYVTPALTVGSHSMTAAYSGDASYNASTGSAINITVTKATPAILVTAPTTGGNTGQNYVLTVLVASNGIGTAPTGTLTVTGAPSGTTASATLGSTADPTYGNTSAVANIIIPGTAAAGTYNLTISYGGDGNYNTASTTYTLTEGAAATGQASSISATATPTSSSATAPITATATVTGQSGHPAPTGKVYFLEGLINLKAQSQISEYILAEGTLTAGSGDTSTLTTQINSSGLVQGDNYMTVYYNGDSNYAASSTVLNLSNPLSDFSLVAQMPLVPISASGTVTDTVNLTSVNGFSGTVDLKCDAPAGLSCVLDQSSVNLTSSTTTTTGPISELHKLMLFGSGGGMALGCLFLIGIPARKRKWRTMVGMVLVFGLLSFGMMGCGSGGGTSTGGGGFGGGSGTTVTSTSSGGTSTSNGPNVTVPVKVTITGNGSIAPGSYQVVVTGTASSTSQVHTITITTVVQ